MTKKTAKKSSKTQRQRRTTRKRRTKTSEKKKTAFRVDEKFRAAHKYIRDHIVSGRAPEREVDITAQFQMSKIALDNYVTLDQHHYKEIHKLMVVIREYAQDRSRRRPLNIIMQAEPGSGKSHFIKCLAGKMSQEGVSEVTFNMASFRGVDDFVQPLEAVRNLKVVDKLPLLFLDEFDSSQTNYPLLLPLLWDGELSVGHRELRTGKVVIMLAGSGVQIGDAMKNSKGMQAANVVGAGKLTDLLSRVNGGELTIPGLDEVTTDRDRRVDKVCLTVSLLKQRFGRKLAQVPWAFLRFVADTKFRYGVRSISHLIDLIPSKADEAESLQIRDLPLPLGNVSALKESSLAYHLVAEDGPAAIVESWKNLRVNDVFVRFEQPDVLFWKWFRDLKPG